MKKFSVLLFAVATVALTSCKYQVGNKIEQKDLNAGNEWVYGVHPDSSARQLKNKYTANPDLEAKAGALRDKLAKNIY